MSTIVNSGSTLTLDPSTGLTITSDSTIASGGLLNGAGTVDGNFTLLNQGTIETNVVGGFLSINTGTFTNQGTVRASGSSLYIEATVVTPDLVGTTLAGGVWESTGTGDLRLLSGQIVTDDTTITLDGPSANFREFSSFGGDQPIENTFATIGATGILNLFNARNLLINAPFVDNGLLTLGGGQITFSNGLSISSTGRVAGFGSVNPSGQPTKIDGTIEAQGGTLFVPGASSLSGSGTLLADAGATLGLRNFGTYSASLSFVNNGTMEAINPGFGGTLSITGSYQGTGMFLIQGGTATSSRTELSLGGAVSANVTFDPNFGELFLAAPSAFKGTVAGFGLKDSIALHNITANAATLTGDLLSVTNNGTIVQTLTIDTNSLDYSKAKFSVIDGFPIDTNSTVTVTGVTAAACYRAGTRIRTRTGEVAVEDLAVGDVVVTQFSGEVPIVWIGHRRVDCRNHPRPSEVWPVRIVQGAFGPNIPRRDLWLSPDHAVFVDDVLVPIKYLLDGTAIRQMPTDTVTYYHIELAEHDVVWAEGMPAETYLENDDRAAFDNNGKQVALHPVFGSARWEMAGCAPLVLAGPLIGVLRDRLRAAA